MKVNSVDTPSDPFQHRGGYGQLIILGDLDGGSLALEANFTDGIPEALQGVWIPQDTAIGDPIQVSSAPASVPFLASKCNLRVEVTGGNGSPDIDWFVRPLPIYTQERG